MGLGIIRLLWLLHVVCSRLLCLITHSPPYPPPPAFNSFLHLCPPRPPRRPCPLFVSSLADFYRYLAHLLADRFRETTLIIQAVITVPRAAYKQACLSARLCVSASVLRLICLRHVQTALRGPPSYSPLFFSRLLFTAPTGRGSLGRAHRRKIKAPRREEGRPEPQARDQRGLKLSLSFSN